MLVCVLSRLILKPEKVFDYLFTEHKNTDTKPLAGPQAEALSRDFT